MQLHSTKPIKKELQNPAKFFNAFDEFNERNRQLLNIPEIDTHLFFEDKKNICIVNNSTSTVADNFLCSVITNACIAYHLNGKEVSYNSNILAKKMTLLIDAGNGNNLGNIYLDLVKKSSTREFDIKEILKQIVVLRAFTFHQMLNIIINEIPKFIHQLNGNCKIQIIVVDLLNTLFESSRRTIVSNDNNNRFKSKKDFESNEKLIIEAIDILLNLSNDHFVILTCDNSTNIINRSFFYKFSNYLEINVIKYAVKNKKNRKDLDKVKAIRKEILLKIRSKKTTSSTSIKHSIFCDSKNKSLLPMSKLHTSSFNEHGLIDWCVF